jgi:hypothetical protein
MPPKGNVSSSSSRMWKTLTSFRLCRSISTPFKIGSRSVSKSLKSTTRLRVWVLSATFRSTVLRSVLSAGGDFARAAAIASTCV